MKELLASLAPYWPLIVLGLAAVIVALVAYLLRNQIRWIINLLMKTWDIFWHLQMWIYPAILLGVGYLFSGLHTQANVDIPTDAQAGVIVVGVIGIVLFVLQLATASSPRTSLGGLAADFTLAAIWSIGLSLVAGEQWGQGSLPFWIAIPTIFVYLDLFVNTIIALRVAWQHTEISPAKIG